MAAPSSEWRFLHGGLVFSDQNREVNEEKILKKLFRNFLLH